MALDAELQDVLRRHCSSLGTSFISKGASRVLAQPSNRLLFAKTGSVDQVLGEAESLNAMYQASLAANHSQTLIPTIHAFGKTSNGKKGFLVTDYKNLSGGLNSNSQRTLGEKLAQMHLNGTSENGMYGFSRPTHCGATEQDNTWTANWSDFWADRRIGDLINRSGDKELAAIEVQLREKVYPLLFNQEAMKDVRPSIIHGDLWSGNAGTDQETGQPIIFDPSSSYSHNEAELGIMKMFGGFGKDFFDAYHQVIPKAQPYYNERQDMYEAYHHLNHFVIFGGSYRSGAIRIFKRLIAWAEREGKNGNGGDGGNDGGGGPGSGTGTGSRGLRGGNRHTDASSSSNQAGCSSSTTSKYPPPPPGAAGSTYRSNNGVDPSSHRSPISGTSFPPATPSQIADYFSQMICYLWFSSGVPGHSMPTTPSRSPTSLNQPLQSSPLAPRRFIPGPFPPKRRLGSSHAKTASTGNLSQALSTSLNHNDLSKAIEDHLVSASTSTMTPLATSSKILANDPMLRRLQPKSRFLRFSREILSTTQVSSSVITLALIYVHRLKAAHPHLKGRDGSEFRLAISSLMLANKILDDNTYLNKTWAEISGMPLIEISKMEVEFWLGLKMELHITKEDYEIGLGELQMLANDRNKAVLQRDAAMKRAIQQQAFVQSQQWAPYMQPLFSASSDGLTSLPDQMHQPRSNSTLPSNGIRRSVGNVDTAMSNQFFTGTLSPGHSAQSASNVVLPSTYDFGSAMSNYNAQTPPYFTRPNTLTLPPSPLSQASAGVHVANVNGYMGSAQHPHAYQGDMIASSPSSRDRVSSSASQSISGDSIWSMLHQGGTSMEQSLSTSAYHTGSQSTQTNETSPLSSTTSTGFAPADYYAPSSRPSLSTQSSSTLSGLKRDFEKTNLDPASSPIESYQSNNKRFAAEPNIGNDLRHYQISSSRRTSQSPTETRYSLRSRSRATAAAMSGHAAQRSTSRDVLRPSVSPNHFSSFSRQISPALQRSGSSLTNVPRAVSAQEVHSHQPHPNYHSVFTSALTPNTLAAPLDSSMAAVPPRQPWHTIQSGAKKVGPLQYYSLAAGEPFGNIGTYLPPPTTRGWNVDSTGARRTSMLADARSNSYYSHQEESASEDQMASWTHHHSLDSHAPPLSAPSFNFPSGGMTAANSGHNFPHSKDDDFTSSMATSKPYDAPFSLDVDAWPLNNSATSNFLFPYHLLPQHIQSSKQQQHHHQQHSHMIP